MEGVEGARIGFQLADEEGGAVEVAGAFVGHFGADAADELDAEAADFRGTD